MISVHEDLRVFSQEQLDNEIQNTPEDKITPLLLIKIDHFYHNDLDTYDGGLSFLDRISAKIGQFHWYWKVAKLKDRIRRSPNRQLEYVSVISEMFSRDGMIAYYGL